MWKKIGKKEVQGKPEDPLKKIDQFRSLRLKIWLYCTAVKIKRMYRKEGKKKGGSVSGRMRTWRTL